tara:strand:- start:718 stop:1323 length:606 start_codon:yes stop_codon:yes gene_type:complete
MYRKQKSLAILQLLNKLTYRKILLINGWDELSKTLAIYTNKLVMMTSNELKKRSLKEKKLFDLVIVFSPTKSDLDFISKNINSDSMEMLCVANSKYTYNKKSVEQYQKSVNSKSDALDFSKIKQAVFEYEDCSHPMEYSVFPSIFNPELILSKEGLKYYRRYWSWKKSIMERRVFIYLFELICVKYLKCFSFLPIMILKVN